MYRLLSLPNEVDAANSVISYAWDAIGRRIMTSRNVSTNTRYLASLGSRAHRRIERGIRDSRPAAGRVESD